MDAITLLKTAGQLAGIGGIVLVVFLLLYRDIIRMKFFPRLTKNQGYRLIRLIAVMIFLIALAGLGSWVWVEQRPVTPPDPSTSVRALGGVAAGGDVDAGKIDIRHTDTPTPASDNHPDDDVTAEGGVAAGGNVKAEEIKIGDP